MSLIPIIGGFVILATIIGFFGRKYRFGFWGYFFMSILLTPVVGLLALIAAMPKSPPRPVRSAKRD